MRKQLALIPALLALPILAFAQEEPPPTKPAPAASGAAAPAAAGSGAHPVESEGEGEDHKETPTPTPKPAAVAKSPIVLKDGMARIPGGKFTMGSDDKKAPPNERPARIVTVSPFWIDRTEVTVAAYRACVDKGQCPKPSRTAASCTYDLGDPALPISCVPWASAQAFCVAANKRLPREVEWEMAARGSASYRFPWGSGSMPGCGAAVTLTTDSGQKSCAKNRPARVASHPAGASPFGVHDMSGNVEEWVFDYYADAVSDRAPSAGASHVLRGGGWLSPPSAAKTTSRNWGSAREMGPNVGFRCARDDV